MKLRVIVVCMVAIVTMEAMAQAPAPKRDARPWTPEAQAQQEQEDVQALNNDVAHMRTLLQQMQMNLALVSTLQDPLKHQFQLEIDMWQVVLNGMERRLRSLREKKTGGVVSPGTVPLRPDSRQGKP